MWASLKGHYFASQDEKTGDFRLFKAVLHHQSDSAFKGHLVTSEDIFWLLQWDGGTCC